jgi:hypothetical protein
MKKKMKQTEKEKYSRKFTIRFTEKEFEQIENKFKNTTCRKLSDYLRSMIMNKPLKVTYRNQSADEFLAGMIALKNELNAIGNNFDQSVRHLYSLTATDEIKTWLLLNESTKQALMSKVEEIKLRMQQLYELWSQK